MNNKVLLLSVVALLLSACGEDETSGPDERATAVTVTAVESQLVERTELAVGRLRATTAPAVSAETAGRIARIHADVGDAVDSGDVLAEIAPEVQRIAVNSARAERARLEALRANQQRQVQRFERLAAQQSVAEDRLDEAVTQLESIKAQLEAAQARLEDAEYNLEQTRILSPVNGIVQARLVSVGDYVSPGVRVYELVSTQALRAFLPLPEHLQDRIAVGQSVRLSVPARPDAQIEAQVSELRPSVGDGSRAIELIVDLDNPRNWRPGGSVTGHIVLERHEGQVVPPTSLVRRPDGEVVYVVDGKRARERQVQVGLRGDGWVEIADGLEAGEQVVVDGAGFLSDGALLDIKKEGEAT